MFGKTLSVGGLLLAVLFVLPVPGTPSPAHIRYVEGDARLQRASEPEPEPGELNVPIFPGDRLWTSRGSRAEVRLDDGTLLRLSEGTKVDFVALGDENILRLWSGSAILKVVGDPSTTRIDAPAASVFPREEGTYRLDVDGEALELAVERGTAELSTVEGSAIVVAGTASRVALGEAPSPAYAYNTARWDELDRFSDERDRAYASSRGVLVRSLPHAVQHDAPLLERHGTWTAHPDYGQIWYPTVSVGWAPYRYGQWRYTSFGYSWVSSEPWGWAPYHYGRWGHGHRGWYWIPGNTWAPAWVSFAFGNSWIGWSPLGYRDRPVYVFNQIVYNRHRRARPRDPWRTPYGDPDGGWNFVDRRRFDSPTRGGTRLNADDVRSSGAVRVLPSPAVLDRDLAPRTAGRMAAPRSTESRRGNARFETTPRRLARPTTDNAAAVPSGARPAPSTRSVTVPRSSVRRTGVTRAPSRARDADTPVSSPAATTSPTRSPNAGERRGDRWTTSGTDRRPRRTTVPSPRTRAPFERASERAIPRGATPSRAVPSRAVPRATPSGEATRSRAVRPPTSSRGERARRPSATTPPRSAPTRAVTPRSAPSRATPGASRAPVPRSAPATRGTGSRENPRSRGSAQRKN